MRVTAQPVFFSIDIIERHRRVTQDARAFTIFPVNYSSRSQPLNALAKIGACYSSRRLVVAVVAKVDIFLSGGVKTEVNKLLYHNPRGRECTIDEDEELAPGAVVHTGCAH